MTVTLQGKEYPLRFSVNALCCLEEKTGLSLARLQERNLSCLRGLIWCGLLESGRPLTLEEAGNLLDGHLRDGGDLKSVAEALSAALEDACFFPPRGRERKTAAPSGSSTGA